MSRSEANARLNEEAGGYGFGSFGDEAVSSVGEGAFGAAGGEIGLAPSLSGGDYEYGDHNCGNLNCVDHRFDDQNYGHHNYSFIS